MTHYIAEKYININLMIIAHLKNFIYDKLDELKVHYEKDIWKLESKLSDDGCQLG